eukprot:CAMPEP_0116888562 /NCGR_PEP_ID=MMETSP0463-20121206/23655_1 /TAXON_ID=181622 /ORGANISM="Strombidinopsis sp, Strain SopsisLIS2011" /LENGTH=60 /DNA_ID=CAMNT_0004553593 /DNA_START=36 /DNA_END=218 /DNA_ORIENTATION=+
MVVKRALRIGTFDTKLKEFIGNSMQIEVDWNPKKEGEWKFPDKEAVEMACGWAECPLSTA